MTRDFIHRAGPEILEAALPPKAEHVVLLRLTPRQEEYYKAYLEVGGGGWGWAAQAVGSGPGGGGWIGGGLGSGARGPAGAVMVGLVCWEKGKGGGAGKCWQWGRGLGEESGL